MFGINSIFLAIAMILASTSARVITQNTIASALQEILAPTNTDKALQLIQLAAKRANQMPDLLSILGQNEPCYRELPARAIYANDLSNRVINSYDLPTRVINANELSPRTIYEMPSRVIYGKDLPGCTICGNKLPGCSICANDLPTRLINANELPVQKKIIREMPARLSNCQENDLKIENLYQSLMESLLFPKELFGSFSPSRQEVVKEVPTSFPPPGFPGLMNPFLPAASPVSTKTSCFPPPTQSRGQFLRKIPIPPPTL